MTRHAAQLPFLTLALLGFAPVVFSGETYVDFKKDVWPFLKQNCIACHSGAKTKGDLNMESVESMMKGGESGVALVKGHADQSRIFRMAAGLEDETMPPAKNNVGAKKLTKDEVEILKKWIDQGARGFAPEEVQLPLTWRALPPDWQAIHAVTVTRDGQYAFAARSNQIYAYHLPGTKFVQCLGDSKLPPGVDGAPTADRDIIESLAVSPDGTLVAAGGYRVVKIWKRQPFAAPQMLDTAKAAASGVSPDGKLLALAIDGNKIALWDVQKGVFARELAGSEGAVKSVYFSADNARLFSGGADKKVRVWNVADGKLLNSYDASAEVLHVCAVPAVKGFASVAADNMVRIFSAENEAYKPHKEFKASGAVNTFAVIYPEGRTVLAGCADNQLRFFDLVDGREVKKYDHGEPIVSVAAMEGGTRYATAGGTTLKLWKNDGNQPVATLKGDRRAAEALVEFEQSKAFFDEQIKYYKQQITDGEKQLGADTEALKKATDGQAAAVKTLTEKKTAFEKAQADKKTTDEQTAAPIANHKKAQETKEAAEKTAAEADKVAKPLRDPAAKARAEANKSAAAMKVLTDASANAENAFKDLEAKQKAAKDLADKAAANHKDLSGKSSAAEAAQKDAAEKLKSAKELATKTPENKELADKAAAFEKTFKDAEAAFKAAKDVADKAAPAVKETGDKLAAASNTVKDAQAKLNAARDAVAKAAPGHRDLSDKAANAEAPLRDAEAKLAAANTARDAAVKAFNELAPKAKEADDKKKNADKTFTDAQNAFNAAEFALTVADQTLERCTAQKKKVEEILAANKTGLSRSEESLKTTTASLETAKKTVAEREKKFLAVAFSPDKKLFAAAAEDGSIHTFSTENGKGGEVLPAPEAATRLAFLPDSRVLASFANSGKTGLVKTLPEWKLERALGSGDEKSNIADRVLTLEFSPDGKTLIAGGGIPSRNGEIKIYNVADGALLKEMPDAHTDTVFSIAWSADGLTFASGGGDKVVRIFDPKTGKQVRFFEGHTSHVTAVVWRRDGRSLVSGGADRSLKVWDLVTGEQKKSFQEVKKPVTAVRYLDPQNEILFTSGDGQIRTVRENGDRVRGYTGKGDYVQAATSTPDGKLVLTGGSLGSLFLYNGLDGKLISSFDPPQLAQATPPAPAKK